MAGVMGEDFHALAKRANSHYADADGFLGAEVFGNSPRGIKYCFE